MMFEKIPESEIVGKNYKNSILSSSVGEFVYFGSYRQQRNTMNKEPIRWRVFAKEGNKRLLVSEEGLDCQKYHSTKDAVTWETCFLRQWLNGVFFQEAFTSQEQALIATSRCSVDKRTLFGKRQWSETQDKVFLLSVEELSQYYSMRHVDCKPTAYTAGKLQGFDRKDFNRNGAWWLRSQGMNPNYAVVVNEAGNVDVRGLFVDSTHCMVRPALWIEL